MAFRFEYWRALLHHFRVNLSRILEAFVDQIGIFSVFVFANAFGDGPYDNKN